jgi:isoleucyl-tRNA synthetase
MRGYRVHFIPGFDCHGAAIEDLALAHEQATSAAKIKYLELSLTSQVKTGNDETY